MPTPSPSRSAPAVAFALFLAFLMAPESSPGSWHVHTALTVGEAAADGWVWPLEGSPVVVRAFDPPPQPWAAGHRGVDLIAGSVAVRAAGSGVVRFAGMVVSRPLVSIAHDGLITTYEPVEPLVQQGEHVRAGQVIGTLLAGHPGCPAQLCLHWGLRRAETYLDPLSLLGNGHVRLLPSAASADRRPFGRGRVRLLRLAARVGLRPGGRSRSRRCRSAR